MSEAQTGEAAGRRNGGPVMILGWSMDLVKWVFGEVAGFRYAAWLMRLLGDEKQAREYDLRATSIEGDRLKKKFKF